MSVESKTAVTVLDHIDNITVPGIPFKEPANEYFALVCLYQGMEFLYRQAKRIDDGVNQHLDKGVQFFGNGSAPFFDGVPKPLLTCSFHWYAVSCCNYVRTIGAIAHRQDSTRPLPYEYAKNVIPEVIAFRDKVAAHFAWSTESGRDNDADRLASVIPPLTWWEDSFYVGMMQIHLRRSGKSSTSDAIKPWSLCKVHDALRPRYWPETIPPAKPEEKEKPSNE
jgi:hypothetical protein